MKIWKARLNLICMDTYEYDLNFNFELLDEDYQVNKNYNEWIHPEGWICKRVPVEATILTSYNNISVTQGFDHELNQEELKDVEMNMRKLIKEKLNDNMEIYKKQYSEKLKVLECGV